VKGEGEKVLYLDDMPFAASDVAYAAPEPGRHGFRNFSFVKGVDRALFRGEEIAHALCTHAYDNKRPSYIVVEVPADAIAFRSLVVSLEPPHSELTFRVLGDGKELWKSAAISKKDQEDKCDVPLKGVRRLQIEVSAAESGRGGHAYWIDPRFVQDPSKSKAKSRTPAAAKEP
jgi:hypothetical protein